MVISARTECPQEGDLEALTAACPLSTSTPKFPSRPACFLHASASTCWGITPEPVKRGTPHPSSSPNLLAEGGRTSIWAPGLEKQHCHTTTRPAAHRHAPGGCKPVPQNCDGRANPAPASAAWQLQGCTCRGEQTSNPGLTKPHHSSELCSKPDLLQCCFFFFSCHCTEKGIAHPPKRRCRRSRRCLSPPDILQEPNFSLE